MVNKNYLRNNIFIFSIYVLGVLISINLKNIMMTFVIIIFMIFIQTTILIIKNKDYTKLYAVYISNKRRYKVVIEALDVVIWEWNSENNKLYISKKIKKILKIDKDINDLEDWLSFVLEEERKDVRVFIENMIENKIVDNFILEHS